MEEWWKRSKEYWIPHNSFTWMCAWVCRLFIFTFVFFSPFLGESHYRIPLSQYPIWSHISGGKHSKVWNDHFVCEWVRCSQSCSVPPQSWEMTTNFRFIFCVRRAHGFSFRRSKSFIHSFRVSEAMCLSWPMTMKTVRKERSRVRIRLTSFRTDVLWYLRCCLLHKFFLSMYPRATIQRCISFAYYVRGRVRSSLAGEVWMWRLFIFLYSAHQVVESMGRSVKTSLAEFARCASSNRCSMELKRWCALAMSASWDLRGWQEADDDKGERQIVGRSKNTQSLLFLSHEYQAYYRMLKLPFAWSHTHKHIQVPISLTRIANSTTAGGIIHDNHVHAVRCGARWMRRCMSFACSKMEKSCKLNDIDDLI